MTKVPGRSQLMTRNGHLSRGDIGLDFTQMSSAAAPLFLFAVLLACSDESDSVSPQSAATVVPIRLVDADPLIEVRINGSPIDVQFDIGRGTTVAIFPSQLESIAKRRVGTTSSGLSMTGPTGERPIYEVDLIEIGDIEFATSTVVEDFHDDEYQARFSSRLNANGFVGRGLFEQYKVVINYQRRELTLIPPASPPEQQALCRGIELPLIQEKDWGLASRIDTDIGELVLVWDTGAPESGVLKRRTDTTGQHFNDGDTLSTKRFIIGGNDIGPETLVVWDWGENAPPFDGFIGYDFFAENVVCVDFQKHAIFLER